MVGVLYKPGPYPRAAYTLLNWNLSPGLVGGAGAVGK